LRSTKPKIIASACFGQHLAHRRRLPDHDAHFQLEIEPLARTEARQLRARRLQLPARPAHFGAGHHDGGGAAVVADRHVQPVRLQRIVLAAEHDADIGGVLLRRIEIGVAGDRDRQMQLGIAIGTSARLRKLLVVAQLRIVVAQQFADPRARRDQTFGPSAMKALSEAREHAERRDIEPRILLSSSQRSST
jgi:hypothetical protein